MTFEGGPISDPLFLRLLVTLQSQKSWLVNIQNGHARSGKPRFGGPGCSGQVVAHPFWLQDCVQNLNKSWWLSCEPCLVINVKMLSFFSDIRVYMYIFTYLLFKYIRQKCTFVQKTDPKFQPLACQSCPISHHPQPPATFQRLTSDRTSW